MAAAADSLGAPPRRFRPLRALGMVVLVLAALAGALVTAGVLARTALLEALVRWQLAGRGIDPIELSVARVGLHGLRLEDVRLGTALTAASVDLAYDPADLARRRLGTVTVEGLVIDASDPAALIDLARRATAAGGAGPALARPMVRIVGARVHGAAADTAFAARVDGRLAADGSGRLVAVLEEARVRVAGHAMGLVGLRADIVVAPGTMGASARFSGATLIDAATVPWVAPLGLAGDASFEAGTVRFEGTATGAVGRLRVVLDGSHDVGAGRGRARLRVAPLVFVPGRLRPGDVVPAAAAAEGVSGRVSATGSASWDPGRVSAEAEVRLADVGLTLGGVRLRAVSATVHLNAPDGMVGATAGLEGGRAEIAVGGRSLRLDRVRAGLAPGPRSGQVELRLDMVRLSDPAPRPWFAPVAISGEAKLAGTAANARLTATAGGARVDVDADHDLTSGRGAARLTLAPLALAPGGIGVADLVPAAAALGAVSAKLAAAASLAWTLDGVAAEGSAEIAGGAWRGSGIAVRDASARLQGGWRDGRLSLGLDPAGAVIEAAGRTFRLDGVHAAAELAGDVAVEVHRARLGDEAEIPWFAPLQLAGEARLAGDTVTFTGRASAPAGALVASAEGGHDLGTGAGAASLRLGPLAFARGGAQPADVVPVLGLLADVDGGALGGAEVRWTAAGIDGTARLALDQVSFAVAGIGVEGLSGSLGLDRLDPPAALRPRTLRARRITGPVELQAPMARFRFAAAPAGGWRLGLERAEAGFAGGRVAVAEADFDGAAGTHALTLEVGRVDLGRLMGLLGLQGVSGSGRLSGRLPLELAPGSVRVRHGRLAALGPGVLKFRSAAARRVLASGGEQATLLLEVLEDFHYQRLSLELDTEPDGEARIRLSTAGANPAVRDAHPFVLNITLSGDLDPLIGAIVEGYRLSNRAMRATVETGRAARPKERPDQ